MSALIESLDQVESALNSAEKMQVSILAEKKAQLSSLQRRIDQLNAAQLEADKELSRSVEEKVFVDTEFLSAPEKRKLLRIWSKLALGETHKVAGEWRAFIGKFQCGDDPNENWNLLKQGIAELQNNK